MTRIYECGSCGVVSEDKGHLCVPKELASRDEFCGTNPDRDICDTMSESVTFECGTCGRAAESKELLCHPHKTRS